MVIGTRNSLQGDQHCAEGGVVGRWTLLTMYKHAGNKVAPGSVYNIHCVSRESACEHGLGLTPSPSPSTTRYGWFHTGLREYQDTVAIGGGTLVDILVTGTGKVDPWGFQSKKKDCGKYLVSLTDAGDESAYHVHIIRDLSNHCRQPLSHRKENRQHRPPTAHGR